MRPRPRLVLLGPGHTHVEVLRRWRTRAFPGASLTCVAAYPDATYSGMLPGVLAGQYRPAAMRLALAPFCAAVGARLVVGEVSGVDRTNRCLQLGTGETLPYDVVSIGIGSVPNRAGVTVAPDAPFVPVKPMQTFLARLEHALAATSGRRPVKVVVVGGGAGGLEIAMTLGHTVAHLRQHADHEFRLITSAPAIAPGRLPATADRVRRVLEARGVSIVTGGRIVAVDAGFLRLEDDRVFPADVVIWAADAIGAPLPAGLDVTRDERGFLLTRPTLQSVDDPCIFAVGDAGTIAGGAVPKAGVYAVRQGPVLWDNLSRVVCELPLRAYVPQHDFLKLLNTGDGRAIGEWRGRSFEGAWCWRLKDAIDRRFMRRYQALVEAAAGGATPASSAARP